MRETDGRDAADSTCTTGYTHEFPQLLERRSAQSSNVGAVRRLTLCQTVCDAAYASA